MSRLLLLVLACWASAQSHARMIQVDFQAQIQPDAPNAWFGDGPIPGTLTGSFTIDTSYVASASYTFSTGAIPYGGGSLFSSEPVLTHYSINGLRRTNAIAYADGVVLDQDTGPTDTFGFGCSTPYTSDCVFSLFAGMSLDFGSLDGMVTASELNASGDPIAYLLLHYQAGSPFYSSGTWGRLYGSTTVTMREVPEPGTLALLGLGLAGLGMSRRRIARQGPRSALP